MRLSDDPAVLAYIAGIIDGEGSVTLVKSVKAWWVSIVMTDQPLIEWLGTFGGTVRPLRSRGDHLKDQWCWRVMAQNDLVDLLTAVLPYLRIKKPNALAALADIRERQAAFAKAYGASNGYPSWM